MKMKLNFKITKETNIEFGEVINKIDSYLKQNDYKIIIENSNMISFTGDERTTYATRSDYYKRIDEGEFKIAEKSLNITTLTLNYKVSITFEFILLTALFFAGIFINHGAFILYGAFLLNLTASLYYIYANTLENILES